MNYFTATALLSIERIIYALIWNRPTILKLVAKQLDFVGKEPELICLFVSFFKCIAVYVVCTWFYERFGFSFPNVSFFQLILGTLLISIGQFLNAMVWYRIGIKGVCYGNKFGHKIPWCRDFPFNTISHPQYTGVVLTVWGTFVFAWSQPDWYIIPLIETGLYSLSMYWLET